MLSLLFADDIKLAKENGSTADLRRLRTDIDNVKEWSQRNRLPFNLAECEVVIITKLRYILCTAWARSHYQEVQYFGVQQIDNFYLLRDIEWSITTVRQINGIHTVNIERTLKQSLFGYVCLWCYARASRMLDRSWNLHQSFGI